MLPHGGGGGEPVFPGARHYPRRHVDLLRCALTRPARNAYFLDMPIIAAQRAACYYAYCYAIHVPGRGGRHVRV